MIISILISFVRLKAQMEDHSKHIICWLKMVAAHQLLYDHLYLNLWNALPKRENHLSSNCENFIFLTWLLDFSLHLIAFLNKVQKITHVNWGWIQVWIMNFEASFQSITFACFKLCSMKGKDFLNEQFPSISEYRSSFNSQQHFMTPNCLLKRIYMCYLNYMHRTEHL